MARRRVMYNQLESLWEFVNEHRNIATGYNKTTQAREFSKRMWESVALILNSQGEGAVKDWKSWNKYWNDYKSKLKSKVAVARSSQQLTGGEEGEAQLTKLELKFLQILGEDFGAGLPGARVESFDKPIQELLDDPIDVGSGADSQSLLVNLTVPLTFQEFVARVPASRAPPPPPPATGPARGSRAAAAGAPRLRERASPSPHPMPRSRQRRHVHRHEPITMDTARRSLIKISERRAVEDRRRNDLMESLVQEIRGIKEILSSRLRPLPSTNV